MAVSADNYTGWDLGGAHLKVARLNGAGAVASLRQFATPLWQGMDVLDAPVSQVLDAAPAGRDMHVLTMTGELADCFSGRREGVRRLLNYMTARLGRDRPLYVYAGREGLVTPARAAARHAAVASANWHAVAAVAARSLDVGILVDVGTTTTDVIPFAKGRVRNQGYTDQERLRSGELVYTGVARTPVMAVAERLPFKNVWQSLAAEHFATMADVYRINGMLDEGCDLLPAADGGAKTRAASARRLARMLGADYEEQDDLQLWVEAANHLAGRQSEKIGRAVIAARAVLGRDGPGAPIVAAGAGRFIAARLAAEQDCGLANFEDLLPAGAAAPGGAGNCATAVAAAWLGRAEMHSGGIDPRTGEPEDCPEQAELSR